MPVIHHVGLDLSEEHGDQYKIVIADVLAVLAYKGKRLYAVTAIVDDAPWFGLIHQDSTVFRGEI